MAGSSQAALKDGPARNGLLGSTLAADPALAALACHGHGPWARHSAQQTPVFFSDLSKSGAALPGGLRAGKAGADPTAEMVELSFSMK